MHASAEPVDPPEEQPRRRRRWLRRSLWTFAVLVVLGVVWLGACYEVVSHPKVNQAEKVDAILVLGPSNVDGRSSLAYDLGYDHYAPTLVISVVSDYELQMKNACHNTNDRYQVICFRPDPGTTRGEAEEIGRLAKQHGWKSIIVVTSSYHISRARLVVSRCMPGKVLMVAAPGKLSKKGMLRQYVYQTAGFLKAFVHPSC